MLSCQHSLGALFSQHHLVETLKTGRNVAPNQKQVKKPESFCWDPTYSYMDCTCYQWSKCTFEYDDHNSLERLWTIIVTMSFESSVFSLFLIKKKNSRNSLTASLDIFLSREQEDRLEDYIFEIMAEFAATCSIIVLGCILKSVGWFRILRGKGNEKRLSSMQIANIETLFWLD